MGKNKKIEKVFIWGAGGHGRGLVDIFNVSEEFEPAYFIDGNPDLKGKFIQGVQVIGGQEVLSDLKKQGIKFGIAGVGDIQKRSEMYAIIKENGFSLANAIDRSAIISKTAEIGAGVTIWAGSIIGSNVIIKDNVIINDGVIVGHDGIVGFGSDISGGVNIMGGVTIGDKTFVGLGANIICKNIGSNSVIGAGSLVAQDIPDNVVAIGFPARVVRKRNITEYE